MARMPTSKAAAERSVAVREVDSEGTQDARCPFGSTVQQARAPDALSGCSCSCPRPRAAPCIVLYKDLRSPALICSRSSSSILHGDMAGTLPDGKPSCLRGENLTTLWPGTVHYVLGYRAPPHPPPHPP